MPVSVGKWTKHQLMSKDEQLSSFLPKTQYLNKDSLNFMLDKYNKVMIKPCFGCLGIGIVQITSLNNGDIELHKGNQKIIINGKEKVYDYLKANHFKKKKPRYIVQQKIPLATINNKPFDIRVMVQRKIHSSEWVITGKLAKVAATNFVITNVARAILSVENAIEKSELSNEHAKDIIAKVEQVSLLISQHLEKSYTKKRIYGIDIGIDQEGKLWIIEANLNPSISAFKILNDGSYETIKLYKEDEI